MKLTRRRVLWGMEHLIVFVLGWTINAFIIWILGKGLERVPNVSSQIAILVLMAIGGLGILALTIGYMFPKYRGIYHVEAKVNLLGALVVGIGFGILAPLTFFFEFIYPLLDKTQHT